jgi:hypothetical protein
VVSELQAAVTAIRAQHPKTGAHETHDTSTMLLIHRLVVEKYIIAPAKYHISAAILSLAPDRVPEAVTVFEKEIRPLFEATYATSAPMLALTGLNHFRVCYVLVSSLFIRFGTGSSNCAFTGQRVLCRA